LKLASLSLEFVQQQSMFDPVNGNMSRDPASKFFPNGGLHNGFGGFRIGFHQSAGTKFDASEPPHDQEQRISPSGTLENVKHGSTCRAGRFAIVAAPQSFGSVFPGPKGVDDMGGVGEAGLGFFDPGPSLLGVEYRFQESQKLRPLKNQLDLRRSLEYSHGLTVSVGQFFPKRARD
jgi:hypothetical protein